MGRSTFIVIALTLSLVCSGIPVSAAYETGPAGVTQGEVLMNGIGFFGGNTPLWFGIVGLVTSSGP